MLASVLASLSALPLLAAALPSANPAPLVPDTRSFEKRWKDDQAPTIWARADVKSTDASGLNISARFEFEGYFDGTPTFIKVKVNSGLFKNFTNKGTQPAVDKFAFHVHQKPITDGFASAQAHLDTLNLTEGYIADPAFPQYAQNGDLSGKHGALNGTSTGKIPAYAFSDDYVRFFPEAFSILGRSIIIHGFNKTRIAGGNIISPYDGTADMYWNPTGAESSYNPPASIPDSPKSPSPAIIFANGTTPLNQTYLDSLPYPFPFPLIGISESVNVKLVNATNAKGLSVPNNEKSSEDPPFKGSQIGAWGWTW